MDADRAEQSVGPHPTGRDAGRCLRREPKRPKHAHSLVRAFLMGGDDRGGYEAGWPRIFCRGCVRACWFLD